MRKLDASGTLLWRYMQRDAGSNGLPDIAQAEDGRLYVTTYLTGTEQHGIRGRPRAPIVLAFTP